jgi:hypothetical protein
VAFDLVPPDATAHAAAETALRLTRIDVETGPAPNRHAWLAAARAEAVDRDPRSDERYALSPRRTRGATRA